jgi:hypothetical protein
MKIQSHNNDSRQYFVRVAASNRRQTISVIKPAVYLAYVRQAASILDFKTTRFGEPAFSYSGPTT